MSLSLDIVIINLLGGKRWRLYETEWDGEVGMLGFSGGCGWEGRVKREIKSDEGNWDQNSAFLSLDIRR